MSDTQVATEDLDVLRRQMTSTDEARRQADEKAAIAAKERDEALKKAEEEVSRRVQSDEVAIVNGLAAASAEVEAAEAALANAGDDRVAMAQAVRKLSTAQSRLDSWQSSHDKLQNWKKSQAAELANRTTQQQAQPQQQARTNGAIDTSQFDPATREWLSKHPELTKDMKSFSRAQSFHFAAIADGLIPETPEYFKYLDEKLAPAQTNTPTAEDPLSSAANVVEVNLKAPEANPVPAAVRERQAAPASSAALSPSRSGPNPARGDDGKVRLTQGQQEAALISFPHLPRDQALVEYARNLVLLQQEGRL